MVQEVTFVDVLRSLVNVYGTIQAVTAESPCAQAADCMDIAQIVADVIGSALGSAYKVTSPGGLPCAQAVVALEALASTFNYALPLDVASGANVLDRANDVLAVIAPEAVALTRPAAA